MAVLDLLLPHGDALAAGNDGRAPLRWAAERGSASFVARLLPLSDPARPDMIGVTPLMFAAMGGHVECVELISGACDPRGVDLDGRSALDLARGDAESTPNHARCAEIIASRILAIEESEALRAIVAKPQAPSGRPPRM